MPVLTQFYSFQPLHQPYTLKLPTQNLELLPIYYHHGFYAKTRSST